MYFFKFYNQLFNLKSFSKLTNQTQFALVFIIAYLLYSIMFQRKPTPHIHKQIKNTLLNIHICMIFYFIVSFLSLTCIVQVSHLKLLEICAVFNCLSYEPYPQYLLKKCFDIFLCIYLLNIKFQFLKISFGITFLYMLMYNFS